MTGLTPVVTGLTPMAAGAMVTGLTPVAAGAGTMGGRIGMGGRSGMGGGISLGALGESQQGRHGDGAHSGVRFFEGSCPRPCKSAWLDGLAPKGAC